MKRKYIFLTFAVFGIGGTQIYVRNKMKYLRENGWDVQVVTSEPKGSNKIVVKELSSYGNNLFPEMMNNPNLYTSKEKSDILDRMSVTVGEITTDSVIESNFIQATLWGELLAERLHIRHFILLIQEEYMIKIKSYLRFFKYKLDRGEFAVNVEQALSQMFDGFCNYPDGKTVFLRPLCHNSVENCDSDIPGQLPEADHIVGSIGRINKPFVTHMTQDVVDFAKTHPDKTFLLLLIGGSPDKKDEETLFAITETAPNIKLFITGAVFPVPKCLFNSVDVFVSSAGAARASADEGYVTVTIDANDYQPIGVLNYTTDNTIQRPITASGAEILPLSVYLEEIIFNKKYTHTKVSKNSFEQEAEREFGKHLNFISKFTPDISYYQIRKIRPAAGLILRRIKSELSHKRRTDK